MLYDQAQLLSVYADLIAITGNLQHQEIANDIVAYVRNNLNSGEGGFFSGEDADSHPTHDSPEKREGAFAVWEKSEIVAIFGDNESSKLFCDHYGISEEGNIKFESDPHGELKRKNVLIQIKSIEESAKKFGLTEKETRDILKSSRDMLLQIRSRRPKPHLDDKIIVSWNGLMISALAKASIVFENQSLVDMASRAATFIHNNLYDKESKTLKRSYREGPSSIQGFADDYAFLIDGLINLYQATFDESWLKWALDLQSTLDSLFFDSKDFGYFHGVQEEDGVPIRLKEDSDAAEPSPNSVAVLNLLRLAAMTGNSEFKETAKKVLQYAQPRFSSAPRAMPLMVVGQMLNLAGVQKVQVDFEVFESENKGQMSAEMAKWDPTRVFVHNNFLKHTE